METLAPELVEIFHSCCNTTHSNDATEQWVRGIHFAFYSAKSTNKFLALEATLTDVFTRLSSGEHAQFFWDFVVHVLLTLAQEPSIGRSIDKSCKLQTPTSGKKSAKKCQPNAPLAFLVVNALKRMTSGDATNQQTEFCRMHGRNHEELRRFCTRGLGNSSDTDHKLLVEVLGLFSITDIDPGLVRNALEHLLASKSHAALIKLCETFTEVNWPFENIVKRMVQTKDWTSAELMVRTFEADDTALAKVLIDETIDLREFKRAHRFVSNFNLQKQYPDIDVLYSRDGLMRLIETQRWHLALTFVGSDTTLQKVLLEHMVAAGDLVHFAQLVKKMLAAGFEPDISLKPQTQLKTEEMSSSNQHAIDDGTFLTLPPENQNIVFCASEDGVREVIKHFFGLNVHDSHANVKADDVQMVGLDVEWKPITSRSRATTAVASILQIASSDQVFIIDLLALHDNDLLFDSFLFRLLVSPQWLKLGFNFDSDLKVLHQTFPERQAFATISPFLDLSALVLKFGDPVGTSLSQCVRHVLGKPLDKRMQLSDWEQRPLSQNQLNYAALDALCLVQVIDKLQHLSNNDNCLPCWHEAFKCIAKLDHVMLFNEAEIVEATSQRIEYQKKWLLRCATENEAQHETPLVTLQDVQRVWEERKLSRVHELDATIDATLKILPMDQITAMLKGPEGEADNRNFIAVNSICIFVDETPSVVCIDASCKLDMAQFAKFCGVGRRRVRLATASECRSVFGFTPGTVAPFGLKTWAPNDGEKSAQIKVFGDSHLQHGQFLATGSGSLDEVIWVESKAFFALISIKLIDDISIPRDPLNSPYPNSGGGSNTDYSDVATDGATEKEPRVLEYKFLADSMVTQVGRWLRTIGVDVVAWNPNDVKATRSKDPKSVMLAFAVREDRIVLTRDTSIPSRRDAGACFVLSDDECYKQFREVKLQFGLLDQIDTRSSRCARCNSDTFSPIDVASARKKMSERLRKKVPASVTKFWHCNGCGRIYWEGPKYTPAMSTDATSSADSRVIYRPVPRKRLIGDRYDTRHLPDPLT